MSMYVVIQDIHLFASCVSLTTNTHVSVMNVVRPCHTSSVGRSTYVHIGVVCVCVHTKDIRAA